MSGRAPPSTTTRSAELALIARSRVSDRPLRHEIAPQLVRLAHGRREPDRRQPGRQPVEPREAERQQVAALRGDERVQLVEDDALQAREKAPARRGARAAARAARASSAGCRAAARSAGRACAPACRRCGSRRGRQAHLGDRRLEVARDVDRERLQRRDVERVEAAPPSARAARGVRPRVRQLDEARQEAGQRLAGAGRRDEQRRAAGSAPSPGARADAAAASSRAPRTTAGSAPATAAARRHLCVSVAPSWRGNAEGTDGHLANPAAGPWGGLRRQRLTLTRTATAVSTSPSGRGGRAPDPPGVPGRRSSHCQRAGGAGRQGPALNFYRMPVSWRPARRFWTKVLRSCRRSGLRNRTWPVRAFGPHTGQTRRPSPDPLPASWRPRRSTGRSDQTGVVPNTQGTPESALASRARGSRDPGRRRRSRPTLTTPRESVPRWTGRVST